MIFASDLDRTLIYSKVFLKNKPKDIVLVEEKDGKNISFMTRSSINLLKLVHKDFLFIPTTTRSLEQFNRISIFNNEIIPRYAVVANGGIVIKDGNIDKNWSKIIKKKMATIISPQEFIGTCQFFLSSEEIKSYRCCDNLFVYAVLHDKNLINKDNYNRLILKAEALGYFVTRTGRKIYMIPKFLNKWSPLKYIMENEKQDKIITAGDSILDLPMITNANHAFIPSHGELFNSHKNIAYTDSNIKFTKTDGIQAPHEFLKDVMAQLDV
ncbi:HAD family hydrolase [Clostridium sp. DL1XJH146]